MPSILPEPPAWKAVLGFDFDDTLVLKDGPPEVDERFFDCLKWVRSTYGAAWGIATGRSLFQLIEGLNEAKFPFLPDFVVVREREIFFPGQFGRWVPHDDWNKSCEKDHHRLFRKCKRMLNKIRKFVESESGASWVSVEGDAAGIVASSESEMDSIQELIESMVTHDDLAFERNSIYLRFSHRDYRKGSGLLEAAERWGIQSDQILAVGDNYNDLSMLQPEVCDACGCPSNALPAVKEFCRKSGRQSCRESWKSWRDGSDEALLRPMIGELLAFALVMVIGQFSPGPDMLLLTRTSLAEGLKAGWMMVLGIATGLTLHATLAIGGIAVILQRGGLVATSLKWVAAAYLLWLAYGLLQKPTGGSEVVVPKRSPYLRGLFCNLLNPKALVFFASVVASFLDGPRPDWWPFALWLIVVGEALFFWCLWVWLLQIPKVRAAYRKSGRVLDLIFALILIGLAIHLLIS